MENVTEAFTYTYTPREYHYTLYYYDQSGQLVKTVPPKGVHPLASDQVDRVINQGTEVNPAHTLPSYYRYDSRNQLRIQESPDGGESDFWYDRAGQLRLSQNAVQSAADAYSYTRYDHLGRVVETGEMESTESRSQLLENIEDPGFPDHQTYTCYDITLTSYDQPISGKYPGFEQEYLRTRVSWTAMVEKDRTDTIFTAYSYDAHED
ncbi:hypothetical protein SAMN04488057_104214 [Cyclobacterium lianum]|uniref:YD repeat-containing protein n=1 Tax=Cyclobacterium lianum TaxID=388280 RepID=A0A1M7MC07_9BACT|nr:hypothetical protein [Cyclobacterium lianum]SHM88308.1 hypothetical protein SAMN04488057_104214 [Cyclobacterium lianum]